MPGVVAKELLAMFRKKPNLSCHAIAAERRHGGLIILEAWYGQLVVGAGAGAGSQVEEGNRVVDVRVQLQCLVKDSVLRLIGNTKVPYPGET